LTLFEEHEAQRKSKQGREEGNLAGQVGSPVETIRPVEDHAMRRQWVQESRQIAQAGIMTHAQSPIPASRRGTPFSSSGLAPALLVLFVAIAIVIHPGQRRSEPALIALGIAGFAAYWSLVDGLEVRPRFGLDSVRRCC
jgi:hypothetical protein